MESKMNEVDFMAEDLAEALRDADLGRAWREAYRLKINATHRNHVSPESFQDLISGIEDLLGRVSGAQRGRENVVVVNPSMEIQ